MGAFRPRSNTRLSRGLSFLLSPLFTSLYFDGFFEYLEDFVAQIDTPLLLGIEYLDKLKLSWSRRMNLHVQPHVLAFNFFMEASRRSDLRSRVQR